MNVLRTTKPIILAYLCASTIRRFFTVGIDGLLEETAFLLIHGPASEAEVAMSGLSLHSLRR